ncbi:MAG: polyprenyl synthetase family protein [Kiritimatiellae bacterium]|nr:polyprenyl synthetase family protein [Kiritimatiellia bacterium]
MISMIERTLDAELPRGRPRVLSAAMRYAVGTGGKRIRPLVCLASAAAAGGKMSDARYPAAAIELLHNYTLIHDDLPAMDCDEFRRGKPTVWKKFGEANAILAGDALLSLAFATAAKAPRNAAGIVAALGERGVGVVAGQVEDVALAGRGPGRAVRRRQAEYVYERKTADLFVAAALMGGLAAGAPKRVLAALERYALNLGLAFQYTDDLLDGDGLYPRGETERRAKEATAAAAGALDALGGDVLFLKTLALSLADRKK